jgi:hypothetical protein
MGAMFNQAFTDSHKKKGVAEGSQEINWVKPNFDFEWHEVEEQSKMKQVPVDVRQYYQKHFPNKDAWLKAVQNGKAVVVPPDHAYEIRNAPFDKASLQKVLAPTGHEGPIGPAKEKRVNDLFDKGQVEMPIILKTSQGLWLIGGKTRLGTANYVKGLPAKVWLIGGKQGVAEATGDERFDTMMGQIQREPRIPDAQMPPTDVKDLYQWAVKHHKPYHKIFAKWANREGYKSVAPALQKAGNLDSDALDYWTPDVWKLWYGPDAEMPRHWSKERVPDELRDYLETVFDAYENIWQDWPTEYRQIGDRGVNEGTKGRQDPLSASIKQAGPYAKRYDDMADTFYPMYRFGIAIAGDKDTPSAGPVRAVPTIWMRNAEEAEIVAKAERTVGIKGTVVVPNGDSEELPDTNSVSAVAKPKRNRYGI